MAYYPTQEDIQILKQQSKEIYVKVDLLNRGLKTLESLQANLVSDNLNVDSESKQRRTYSCDLYVTDSTFLIGEDKKIWIDKYIRVYYGVKALRTGEIHWYLIGTFTYVDVSYNTSGTENSLSLSCADMMADFDGTKNGQISGYSLTIPAGEDMRNSIIALIKRAGIEHYNVEDMKKEIPYDQEFKDSTTYCDVWTQICELYDSWEFFFDIDGTFIWRQIPTGLSEPVIADDTLFDEIWVSEQSQDSFSGIYNVTEVWGKVIELELEDRYADSSTYTNNVYSIKLEGVTKLDDIDHLDKIGIKITADCQAGAKVSINGLAAIPIINDDGTLVAAGRLKAGKDYVFSYRRNYGETIQNCLYIQGQFQAYGIYEEHNKDCPFSIENLGYKIINRVNYENLYSDDLCYNQAEYQTYQTTAMRDTITLTTILIPWLDVNKKISYTPQKSGEKAQYLVKNFSWSIADGTMSITLYRFLESYSYVKNKENIAKGRSR